MPGNGPLMGTLSTATPKVQRPSTDIAARQPLQFFFSDRFIAVLLFRYTAALAEGADLRALLEAHRTPPDTAAAANKAVGLFPYWLAFSIQLFRPR